MLLFVKKRFADAIKSGSKTLEIRAGRRYRNLQAGDPISINGHFRCRLLRVEQHSDRVALIMSLRDRFVHAGFADACDASQAIRDCYSHDPEEFYVLHLNPEVPSA